LRDLGDKVPANDRTNIESKLGDLKSAVQTEDVDRIKKTTEEVQNAFYALSQMLYGQGQPQPQPQPDGGPAAPPPPAGNNDGDVIDGEVRDA
jgi:molecular chaperone DnaK